MKVSFSLNKSKASLGTSPSLNKPTSFASLDDDEPIDAAPTASRKVNGSSSSNHLDANRALAAQAAQTKMSKLQKKRLEKEKEVDSTVYEYDEVWDRMQEAKERQREVKEEEAKERKPKYIASLLQSASVRKLDHLRAEEKMIQREREAEGDEFAEKEQFVTQAYKDQMAEVRRAEEEEKKREAAEKAKKGPTSGLAAMYRQMLDQSEAQHAATVAATSTAPAPAKRKVPLGPEAPPSLRITRPDALDDAIDSSGNSQDQETIGTELSDLELAKRARAEGKNVELNDDNQIVDKRDLLSAGLNLSLPNTRHLIKSSKSSQDESSTEEQQTQHRAVGAAASQREIAARRQREIQSQMSEERRRKEEERERKEREEVERAVKKRNTDSDIKSARERYLERKRRKLEGGEAESEKNSSETTS